MTLLKQWNWLKIMKNWSGAQFTDSGIIEKQRTLEIKFKEVQIKFLRSNRFVKELIIIILNAKDIPNIYQIWRLLHIDENIARCVQFVKLIDIDTLV